MNCKDIQQDLALAASDCLDAEPLGRVRQHCQRCASCAEVLRQYQEIASALSQVSREFNDLPLEIREPDQQMERRGLMNGVTERLLNWRWLLPAGGIALLMFVWFPKDLPTETSSVPAAPSEIAAVAPTPSGHIPSLAVYRNALDRSGTDSLEALLARDAEHLMPATSGLGFGDVNGEL